MNYFNTLKTKAIYPLALGAALMLSAPQSFAFCLFNCKEAPAQALHLNEGESVELQAAKIKALESLQTDMVARFTSIEDLLVAGNASEALNEAKQVLDTVRVKTGIDPKIKIVESFLVPTIFPDTAASLQDLNDQQQELVIRTVSEFRGGLYMDIMNLSKRTTLLYIQAFKAVVQAHGGMTKDDQAKIINDLVKASLVPMTIEDKKGNKIIAFDEDIANEDHTYLFNREIKMFLIEDSQLNLSEDSFNNARNNLKAKIVNSLRNQKPVPEKTFKEQCAEALNNFLQSRGGSWSGSSLEISVGGRTCGKI